MAGWGVGVTRPAAVTGHVSFRIVALDTASLGLDAWLAVLGAFDRYLRIRKGIKLCLMSTDTLESESRSRWRLQCGNTKLSNNKLA